jgi:two-component system sensor histidine kinase YesM
LKYNLGKKGRSATLQDEVDAVKEYLSLQKNRYNFNYNIHVSSDSRESDVLVPRFILQPLVENSICHGLNENGNIQIIVELKEKVVISISDDGAGIPQEKINEIFRAGQSADENSGMGIGLNYVKRTLESYYEGKAELQIKSEVGKGTDVILYLPYRGRGMG